MPIYVLKIVAATRINGRLKHTYDETDLAAPEGFDREHRHAPAQELALRMVTEVEMEQRAEGHEFIVESWRLTEEDGEVAISWPY